MSHTYIRVCDVAQAVFNYLEGAAAAKEHGMSVPNPSAAQRVQQEIETGEAPLAYAPPQTPRTLHKQDFHARQCTWSNPSDTAVKGSARRLCWRVLCQTLTLLCGRRIHATLPT